MIKGLSLRQTFFSFIAVLNKASVILIEQSMSDEKPLG